MQAHWLFVCKASQFKTWSPGRVNLIIKPFCDSLHFTLTAAAFNALQPSRGLSQVLLWVEIELLFAFETAEVIRLPIVLRFPCGGGCLYVHTTYGIFNGC